MCTRAPDAAESLHIPGPGRVCAARAGSGGPGPLSDDGPPRVGLLVELLGGGAQKLGGIRRPISYQRLYRDLAGSPPSGERKLSGSCQNVSLVGLGLA